MSKTVFCMPCASFLKPVSVSDFKIGVRDFFFKSALCVRFFFTPFLQILPVFAKKKCKKTLFS